MKKLLLLSLLISFPIYSQETIPIKHQKWDLKSFAENSTFISKEKIVRLENISVPEMVLYRAKGDSKTDKAMIICPGGGLFYSAYEKEGIKLAEKLSLNGITSIKSLPLGINI